MREPEDQLAELGRENLRRELRVIDSPQGTAITTTADGKSLVNFSSNDYLGLANDPELIDAFAGALKKHGVGSGASRLVCGTLKPHTNLEAVVADFKNTEAALTFSSGFAAATGVIPAVVGKNDYIIADKLCHASLIDGARLSGATMRVFPHNDIAKLEAHLQWATKQAQPESRILVLTESVFSMDGDLCELVEICRLKETYQFLLLVDEAHAVGIMGPKGRGLAAQLELEDLVDFQMGTFSKAVGLSGGYLAASRSWTDVLINRARSFIYSTAPSPALAETIEHSLQIISGAKGEELRQQLWKNISELDAKATSAIIPIVIGENEAALAKSKELLENGFLVPAIRYPTVSRGTARLRVTLSAKHQLGEVGRLGRLLNECI